jgi:6-pyruvoyl-tetrahydropterin synthase
MVKFKNNIIKRYMEKGGSYLTLNLISVEGPKLREKYLDDFFDLKTLKTDVENDESYLNEFVNVINTTNSNMEFANQLLEIYFSSLSIQYLMNCIIYEILQIIAPLTKEINRGELLTAIVSKESTNPTSMVMDFNMMKLINDVRNRFIETYINELMDEDVYRGTKHLTDKLFDILYNKNIIKKAVYDTIDLFEKYIFDDK